MLRWGRGLKGLIWTWGLTCLLLWIAPACGNSSPSNSQISNLRDFVREHLEELNEILSPLMSQEREKEVPEALLKYYSDQADQGHPLVFGVSVLNKDGILVAGRYPHPDRPEGFPETVVGTNYSQYHGVSQVLRDRRLYQAVYYVNDGGRLFIVCGPLAEADIAVGVACLGFSGQNLRKDFGISEHEFQEMDFNH
ncbi:MAG: hypothetical protein KQJ78_17630 [Deltaproteobacteria bacterium]|nr:hypothetical protein [Deltaproteobacteria bacterium]